MNPKRLNIIGYCLLPFVGILLFLLGGKFEENSLIQTILFSIASQAIIVTILFVLIERIFLVSPAEERELIKETINNELNSWHWEYHVDGSINESRCPIGELLDRATEIDMMLCHGAGLLNLHQHSFARMLETGAKLRILHLNEKSPALQSLSNDSGEHIRKKIEALEGTLKQLKDLAIKSSCKGSIEIRKMNWFPSISLLRIKTKQGDEHIKISLNHVNPDLPISHDTRKRGRLCMNFRSTTHSGETSQMIEQFNLAWNSHKNT